MTTQSGINSRTLTGYALTLLDYPRWHIERDVDFTHCRHAGVYDEAVTECVDCRFGEGCRWLNHDRKPMEQAATLDELLITLQSAIRYVQPKLAHERHCGCRGCGWLREARHFLHGHQPPGQNQS